MSQKLYKDTTKQIFKLKGFNNRKSEALVRPLSTRPLQHVAGASTVSIMFATNLDNSVGEKFCYTTEVSSTLSSRFHAYSVPNIVGEKICVYGLSLIHI